MKLQIENLKKKLCLLVFAIGLFAPFSAEAAEKEMKGKDLLQKNCARCHSIDETGASILKEAPPLRDIYRQYPPERLEFELSEGIGSSHPDMPQVQFSVDQIDEIFDYLASIAPDD